ncbi:RNA-binding domain-containing protein, partial [Basidiobolus meristosporus CBS 931.73]
TTVFVGGLSWSVDNDWLRDEMKECGEIVDVRVITDRATGKSKGFGYVEFATHEGAKNALEISGKEIDGRGIRVDFSEGKPAAKKPERTFESQNNEPSDTLFIGNLSFNSSEDSIRAAFAECGEVLSIRLPTDRDTGRPKGFGYIQFASIDAAKAAMQWNGSDLDGRNIRLDFAAARSNDGGDRRQSFGGDRRQSFGGRGGRGGGRGGARGGRGG